MPLNAQRASDVRIEFIELVTPAGVINILPQLVSFNMYESLYDESVQITCVINDSTNLPYTSPILGEEFLNFTFSTAGVEGNNDENSRIELNPGYMYSVAITDRSIVKDRQQLYVLHFISQQGISNKCSTVSRSWNNKKISTVVTDIFNDYLDVDETGSILNVEETLGSENIVIPNWKPYQAINWLAQRALNKNGIPNYFFWESNGEAYFKSVDTLMNQSVIQNLIYNPLSDDVTKLVSAKQGALEVDSLEVISQFDVEQNMDRGYYASKLITHDIVTKQIKEITHGLGDVYDGSVNHTDKFMPISTTATDYEIQDRHTFAPLDETSRNSGDSIQSYFDSRVSFWPKHNQMYAKNSNDLYDNRVEDWLLQRNTLKNCLNQIMLRVSMPGLSFLKVGHKIHIDVPAPTKVAKTGDGKVTNRDFLSDEYLSGDYIITAINHNIQFIKKGSTPHVYKMTMELTKDALGSAPGNREQAEK